MNEACACETPAHFQAETHARYCSEYRQPVCCCGEGNLSPSPRHSLDCPYRALVIVVGHLTISIHTDLSPARREDVKARSAESARLEAFLNESTSETP